MYGKAAFSARWMLTIRRASSGVQKFSADCSLNPRTPPALRLAAHSAKNSRV